MVEQDEVSLGQERHESLEDVNGSPDKVARKNVGRNEHGKPLVRVWSLIGSSVHNPSGSVPPMFDLFKLVRVRKNQQSLALKNSRRGLELLNHVSQEGFHGGLLAQTSSLRGEAIRDFVGIDFVLHPFLIL